MQCRTPTHLPQSIAIVAGKPFPMEIFASDSPASSCMLWPDWGAKNALRYPPKKVPVFEPNFGLFLWRQPWKDLRRLLHVFIFGVHRPGRRRNFIPFQFRDRLRKDETLGRCFHGRMLRSHVVPAAEEFHE